MKLYNKVQFGIPLQAPPFNPVTKVIVRKSIEFIFQTIWWQTIAIPSKLISAKYSTPLMIMM